MSKGPTRMGQCTDIYSRYTTSEGLKIEERPEEWSLCLSI